MKKMKIEVWSDVMCPFCYIGKRKLEKSLAGYNEQVEVEWKSYQLSPELITDTSITIDQYLAKHKGMPIEQAKQLNAQVTQLAAQQGLVYNFDKAVVASSLKAHILAHFAKSYGKQQEVEELLFKSYFTDGKNIDDVATLKDIATEIGLDAEAFEDKLSDNSLENQVKMDINEARQIGVQGVPFFVYDRKYAISGAQPDELFLQTLEKSLNEWSTQTGLVIQNTQEGTSCGDDGCVE